MTLLWFQLISPFPSCTHFLKELSVSWHYFLITYSLFVSIFQKYLLSTYYTHSFRDITENKIDSISVQPLWRLHSWRGSHKETENNSNEKNKTYNDRWWLALWKNSRVKVERSGVCLCEPWVCLSSVFCLGFPPEPGSSKCLQAESSASIGLTPPRDDSCPVSSWCWFICFIQFSSRLWWEG